MEMMHSDAGVRNVVIGGRPSYGPMQTPSGSRAARYYSTAELDNDISNTLSVLAEDDPIGEGVIPNRTNQDIYVYDAGISLRNQVREGETTPLQMQFEAADCRIFYTPLTFNNFTNLWKYAAAAVWTNPGLCARGSTGYATGKGKTPKSAPAIIPLAGVKYSSVGIPTLRQTGEEIRLVTSDQPLPDGFPNSIRPQQTYSNLRTQENPQRLKQANQPVSQPISQGVRHPALVRQHTGRVATRSSPPASSRLRRSSSPRRVDFD
jgi:hypothetical protein